MEDQFELSILDSGDSSRAIAVVRIGYDLAIEALDCEELKTLTNFREALVAAARGKLPHPQRITPADLYEFGNRLFNFTVRHKVDTIYKRLPNSHIRLHIYSNRPDLQALPWEYIQQPGTLPGPDPLRSVVRIVPTIGVKVAKPFRLGRKVRILFVYSEPINQDTVEWEDIKGTIEREFQAHLPKRFVLDVVEGGTRQALSDALSENDYDILHFAGHGEVGPDGVGYLLLTDLKTGRRDPYPAANLGQLLKDRNLRLVMLSACSTSAGDFAKEFAVVAQTLVQNNVPAVVANQFPITNSIAAKFARGFYRELLRSGDVDKAATNGRRLLWDAPPLPCGRARIEWGCPTLYRHAGAAKIFEV